MLRICTVQRCLLASLTICPLISWATDEPIAVVAYSGHTNELKKEDLVRIFKRKKLFWQDGSRIRAVNLPVTNPLRLVFSQTVLGATPNEMAAYWNDQYFHGISPPFVLSSEQAVIRFVADTPGAIGYVSLCNIHTKIDVLLWVNAGQVLDSAPDYNCHK